MSTLSECWKCGPGWACLAVGVLCWSQPSWACNVPVFRYALERWPADTYRVTVFHKGKLSNEDRQALQLFDQPGSGNCKVTLVDMARPREANSPTPPTGVKFPCMVAQHPIASQIAQDVFVGPLSKKSVQALLQSPVRKELLRRLQAGDSVVWLFLESGDKTKDQALVKKVETELSRLQKTLKLPTEAEAPVPGTGGLPAGTAPGGAPAQTIEISDKVPYRLRFSLLRVQRDDAAEKNLVRMLLTTEPDLTSLKEPMLFPVFGRGRVLWALVGGGINAENIKEAGQFLTGACSCTVKDANPGKDLLLAGDWSFLEEGKDPVPVLPLPPGQTGDKVSLPKAPAKVEPSEKTDEASKKEKPATAVKETLSPYAEYIRPLLIGGVTLAGLLVAITGYLALRGRK